ncbi:MAG: hypothetical protein NC321_10500 [Clostridium sp.]|nr:hypothetical protein [Clostridium sp.]
MSNTKKMRDESANKAELEELYQIYTRFRLGDKSALNELFVTVNSEDSKIIISRKNERKRMENLDNVLDAEMIMAEEKDKEERREKDNWLNSNNEKVIFRFTCLNKMVYNKKVDYLSEAKSTGYENGEKVANRNAKYYTGKYDVSDLNSFIYETVLEIFKSETDENDCLTLDDKKSKTPICDGVSLLQNIKFFTSMRINKRAENSYLDIYEGDYLCDSDDESNDGVKLSLFDQYNLREFMRLEGDTSRLPIYEDYLEWLKRNNVYRLFKVNAYDIQAIIETIMNCPDTFVKDLEGNRDVDIAMRFIKQEELQEMIKSRHDLDIEQENISKDLRLIEQKLLNHLLYSLNYRIGEAEKSKGIFKKESDRFLYALDIKRYIKIFSRTSYEIYNMSIRYIETQDYNGYFDIVKKYEDTVIDIVSLKKGKKKYDMVNLISEKDNDLVDDKTEALLDIAKTLIEYYQNQEKEYRQNGLSEYKQSKHINWNTGFWETELEDEVLKIKLLSNKDVKKPAQHSINKEKLIVYCGYMNFYFCNVEEKICYSMPKDRRIISRRNKNHEISIYNAD